MKDKKFSGLTVNWILLGLLMLVPGLIKLFVFEPSGVSGMLSGNVLFSWAPTFWAWILIIGEIGSGIAILTKWRVKHVMWIPVIILVIAAFTSNWNNWPGFILHLLAASNYWLYTNCPIGGCLELGKKK